MKKLTTLLIGLSIFIGCSQSEDTPAPPEPVAIENNSNPTVDVGFAISYANNWLIKPNLDDVEKVKKLLEEAVAARPEEVKGVLSQVAEIEKNLKHELLFVEAEELIQKEKYDDAIAKLGEYLKEENSKQIEQAKTHLKLLTYYRSPESAADFMESLFPRERLERLIKKPQELSEYDLVVKALDEYPDSLAEGWLRLCEEQIPQATKKVVMQDRKQKQAAYVDRLEEIKRKKPSLEGRFKIDGNGFSQGGDLVLVPEFVLKGQVKSSVEGIPVQFSKQNLDISLLLTDVLEEKFRRKTNENTKAAICRLKNEPRRFEVITLLSMGAAKRHAPKSEIMQGKYTFEDFIYDETLPSELGGKKDGVSPVGLSLEAMMAGNSAVPNRIDFLFADSPRGFAPYFRSRQYIFRSDQTGTIARTLPELLAIEFDYEKLESLYGSPQSEYECFEKSMLLRLKVPEAKGFMVREKTFDVQTELSSGEIYIKRVFVSSKNEVLIDLLCLPEHSGTLTLKWSDAGDSGLTGTVKTLVKRFAPRKLHLLGPEGVGKVVEQADDKKISSATTKFKGFRNKRVVTVRVESPFPVYRFNYPSTFPVPRTESTFPSNGLGFGAYNWRYHKKWSSKEKALFKKSTGRLPGKETYEVRPDLSKVEFSTDNDLWSPLPQLNNGELSSFYLRFEIPKGGSVELKAPFFLWTEQKETPEKTE